MRTSIYSVCFVLLTFINCQGTNTIESVLDDEQKQTFSPVELNRHVKAHLCAGNQYRQVWWFGYYYSHQIVSGNEHLGESISGITVEKDSGNIHINLEASFDHYEEFPTIYNDRSESEDIANNLTLSTIVSTKGGKKIATLVSTQNVNAKRADMNIEIRPESLRKLRPGMHTLIVEVGSELTTIFDVKSGITPFQFKIEFDFQVPTIYRTKLYFESLTLDEDETTTILGSNNDFNNPTPEVGIRLTHEESNLLYTYKKNSYTLFDPSVVDVYYVNKNSPLHIEVVDVDYGFNGNDLINDTLIPIGTLDNSNYNNIEMFGVEELLIRTEFKGAVNE